MDSIKKLIRLLDKELCECYTTFDSSSDPHVPGEENTQIDEKLDFSPIGKEYRAIVKKNSFRHFAASLVRRSRAKAAASPR